MRAQPLPGYHPSLAVTGEIRVWGSPDDDAFLRACEAGFRKFYPDARLALTLHGPESPLMGVYTGVADFALLAREMRQPAEFMAFTWVWRYPPTLIEVANAAAGTARPNGTLVVFVHCDNPLAQLTLAQLEGIFGTEHKHGADNLRTWGQLGLGGEWRDRPIHAFGPAIDSVAALYFRHVVLADSYKWNAEVKEFTDEQTMRAALAHDPAAIAYASLAAEDAGVKPLALAKSAGGPFVAPTAEEIVARRYPLARSVTIALNRAPGKEIANKTKEFLRFLLSAEGQAIVAHGAGCLPLNAATAAAELKKLE